MEMMMISTIQFSNWPITDTDYVHLTSVNYIKDLLKQLYE